MKPINPKDAFGALKVSLSKFPAVAVAHGAHAMMDGAWKYGPYNWRTKAIIASIYVDSAKRHIDAWFERQEIALDSDVHELGHALACIAIILDAQAADNLIDDRPVSNGLASRIHEGISAIIRRRSAKRARKRRSRVV